MTASAGNPFSASSSGALSALRRSSSLPAFLISARRAAGQLFVLRLGLVERDRVAEVRVLALREFLRRVRDVVAHAVEEILRRRRHSAAVEFVDVRVVQQLDLLLADRRTELSQESP